jgi:hypothetical protein
VAAVGLVHAWVCLVLGLFFALHSALCELLHHFYKFLPIIFQKVVSNSQYTT